MSWPRTERWRKGQAMAGGLPDQATHRMATRPVEDLCLEISLGHPAIGAMRVPGLRHSTEQVGGFVFFGRMLDKMRLRAQGRLPPDYKTTGTDQRVCPFLRVGYAALLGRVLAGASDQEALEWCFTHGRRPSEEEILTFNGFLTKRGWRDNQTEELEQMKRARGFGDQADI